MEKLKSKYNSYQANGLSLFMNYEVGCRFGLYKEKPTILIGIDEDIDGFEIYEGPIEDTFFVVYVNELDPYTEKIDCVLSFIYEEKSLEVYNSLLLEPRSNIAENDRLFSDINILFENKKGIDFALYSGYKGLDNSEDKNEHSLKLEKKH